MRSATSFFNRALLRKNLQRFWPLCFGYGLIWLLVLPLPLLANLANAHIHNSYTASDAAMYVLEVSAFGGLTMAAVFGVFFAMAMFSYLTNPRATQGFHSMPVRRETLYATNYLTGLCAMLVMPAAAYLLTGVVTAAYGCFDGGALFKGLLAAALAVVFFYSFAVFCMMFTGQILAAPVFYGVLNLVAVGMEYLVRAFAGNFLYGYDGTAYHLLLGPLSPVYELAVNLHVAYHYTQSVDAYGSVVLTQTDEIAFEGLWLLGVYAAVGLIFAALGLLVYRRRASEASGSTVAVPWARPIFKYGVALCAAFSLGQLVYALLFGVNRINGQFSLAGTIVCMLFAGLLGYFAAEMLLRKSFRVWRSGRAGALVFSALLACFGFSMSLDLTGYESYLPEADEIESAVVTLHSYGDGVYVVLKEPESIESVLAAHGALIADKDRQLRIGGSDGAYADDGSSYLYFRVNYHLKNGRIVTRDYDCTAFSSELGETGSVAQTATALLNAPETVRQNLLGGLADGMEGFTFTGGYYYMYIGDEDGYPQTQTTETDGELTAMQARTLADALFRDYAAGHASNASLFSFPQERRGGSHIELELWYITPADNNARNDGPPTDSPAPESGGSLDVVVTPELTFTLEALSNMGIRLPEGA